MMGRFLSPQSVVDLDVQWMYYEASVEFYYTIGTRIADATVNLPLPKRFNGLSRGDL
jgi:hypothetical protein